MIITRKQTSRFLICAALFSSVVVWSYIQKHFKESSGLIYVYDAQSEAPLGLLSRNKPDEALIQGIRKYNPNLKIDDKKLAAFMPLTVTLLIETDYHPDAVVSGMAKLENGDSQLVQFRFRAAQSGAVPFFKLAHSAYFDRVGLCIMEAPNQFYCELKS